MTTLFFHIWPVYFKVVFLRSLDFLYIHKRKLWRKMLTNFHCWIPQGKASVEKIKQALESERNELKIELQSSSQGKNESEQRRKKADSQLQELQVKHGESERQKQELADKVSKMQVLKLKGSCRDFYTWIIANCSGNLCLLENLLSMFRWRSKLYRAPWARWKANPSNLQKDCSTVESQLKDTQVQFGHAQFTHFCCWVTVGHKCY